MTRTFKALALLTCALATPAFAQRTITPDNPTEFTYGDRDNGIHANTLLRMGVSPRGVALGEAMGAVEGDASSLWYNAAGIGRIKTNSFFVTGSQRFAETQLAGAAVTFPTALGTFGIAARALNAGTIEVTENNNFLGRARAYQLALEGGGAIEWGRHFIMGGTLFYAQETLGDQSAGSIGINTGFLFPELFFRRLTLGTGFRNWGTPVTFEQQSARTPRVGYVAAAMDLLKRRNLMATPMLFKGSPIILDAKAVGQVDFPDKREYYAKGGIEATVNGVLIGRIGYQMGDDNNRGLSLGSGINVGQFRLEYAFRNRHNAGADFFEFDPIGDEHHVSAMYFWGGAQSNAPVVPVIVTQPVDTAAINAAVRGAVEEQLAMLRPLLDSLRRSSVEIRQEEGDLVARYIVPVHFGFDSSSVREDDMVLLGQIADVIKRIYPTALVTIEGFADPSGSDAYNMRLSKRRADAVKSVMTTRFGLPDEQFKTVAYGEQFARQVTPGARRGDAGAEANRRVTFTIDATQHF